MSILEENKVIETSIRRHSTRADSCDSEKSKERNILQIARKLRKQYNIRSNTYFPKCQIIRSVIEWRKLCSRWSISGLLLIGISMLIYYSNALPSVEKLYVCVFSLVVCKCTICLYIYLYV